MRSASTSGIRPPSSSTPHRVHPAMRPGFTTSAHPPHSSRTYTRGNKTAPTLPHRSAPMTQQRPNRAPSLADYARSSSVPRERFASHNLPVKSPSCDVPSWLPAFVPAHHNDNLRHHRAQAAILMYAIRNYVKPPYLSSTYCFTSAADLLNTTNAAQHAATRESNFLRGISPLQHSASARTEIQTRESVIVSIQG